MKVLFFSKAQIAVRQWLLIVMMLLGVLPLATAKEVTPAKSTAPTKSTAKAPTKSTASATSTKSVGPKKKKTMPKVAVKPSKSSKSSKSSNPKGTQAKTKSAVQKSSVRKVASSHHKKPTTQKVATRSKPIAHKPRFSSIAVDAVTGNILAADDIDGLRHPASLTKVMTLYVLFQDLKARRVYMNTELLVTSRAANMAPSKLGLKSGQTISVEDSIKALVTKSANDVAATVAENLAGTEDNFALRMTQTAHSIGMNKTIFKSASGLPNKGEWTTARDMATLSLRVQRDFPEYYHYFSTIAFSYKGQVIRTHNKLLGNYEGADGIKTGYIARAGFNLTSSAKRGDKRLVGVVIGATSTESRNQYMIKLLNENFPKCTKGNTIASSAGQYPAFAPGDLIASQDTSNLRLKK